MHYWLLKSEPHDYSIDDLSRDGHTCWDGVRNFQARNYLKAMKIGDLAFFYEAGKRPGIVGIAKVIKTSYPDPTDDSGRFVAIDICFVEKLSRPIPLSLIKSLPGLKNIPLLKQSRLSVMPVTEAEWMTLKNI